MKAREYYLNTRGMYKENSLIWREQGLVLQLMKPVTCQRYVNSSYYKEQQDFSAGSGVFVLAPLRMPIRMNTAYGETEHILV